MSLNHVLEESVVIHTLRLYINCALDSTRKLFFLSLPFPSTRESREAQNKTLLKDNCIRHQQRLQDLCNPNQKSRAPSTTQIRKHTQRYLSQHHPTPAHSSSVLVPNASWPDLNRLLTVSFSATMCTTRQVITIGNCGHVYGHSPDPGTCSAANGVHGGCGTITTIPDRIVHAGVPCQDCRLPN